MMVSSFGFFSGSRWRAFLGFNSSTLALLGAILLVTAGTELWSPLVPQYMKSLQIYAQTGDAWLLILVGLYGLYRDGLEAVNYYVGGALGSRLNTRHSLLLFNLLPLVGLIILGTWQSIGAVFLAIPFIFVWDSIAGPATITVVGDSLPSDRRTMAFSLQAIFRRLSRIIAYWISAPLIWYFGEIQGLRIDVVIAIGLILLAWGIQFRYMKTTSRDLGVMIHRPWQMIRRFDPNLKRLLVADILARWAEGLAGPFIILYSVPLLSDNLAQGTAIYQSVLLSIQAITNIILYILIGPLASRSGLAKKPYIGLTFLFFALFPISLAILPPALGFGGLALAFVIGGVREIGEPARKAMISELVPAEYKTQAIGLYWSARSASVMWAGPIGAILWIWGNQWQKGWGPLFNFGVAGVLGILGATSFFIYFGRSNQHKLDRGVAW